MYVGRLNGSNPFWIEPFAADGVGVCLKGSMAG